MAHYEASDNVRPVKTLQQFVRFPWNLRWIWELARRRVMVRSSWAGSRLATLTVLCLLVAFRLNAGELKWKHFAISNPLPGNGTGTAGPVLGDFKGDGHLAVALSRRDTKSFYWYERKSDSVWVQHLIYHSNDLLQGLGAAALDVDGDGFVDVVFDQVWFKNPGNLRTNPDAAWEPHVYEHSNHEVHDIVAADINRDGRQDIVTFDGDKILWYDTAHGFAVTTVAEGFRQHGGIAPHGVGDIDGDGYPDIVIAGSWFKNPGKAGGQWVRHSWPYLLIPKATYGTSIRSWVVDLNGDGQNDIVYSDSDTGYGHVYWVKNEGKGLRWTRYQLPDPPNEKKARGTGSWHSLGVADFNGDGKLDVFAGEQEDPDFLNKSRLPMKPKGLEPRGVIWINSGSTPPTFVPHVIHKGIPGWHDACLGDVNGDGKTDIVSAIWNTHGPTYHADYWRNNTATSK